MRFDSLDKQMRVFETCSDLAVLPDVFVVARVDGRSFTRLTREAKFEKPFDITFRDLMIGTAKSLMQCGFDVIYAYTQSDEISLLLRRNERLFGRKLRKVNSILAAEASATFSLNFQNRGIFDCRISQLPNEQRVCDYFRWRAADAFRNALNRHCYWALRKSGLSATRATKLLLEKNRSNKQELLFQKFGMNFNDVPSWQKRGVGLVWEKFNKRGFNPQTGKPTLVTRRRIRICDELPVRDKYSKFIRKIATE